MRSSASFRSFVLGTAVAFCFCRPTQPEVPRSLSAAASERATPEQRANAVEQSLAPLYYLAGERPTHSNLRQRMTELNIPGVTIAAIHDGHVDWARGYGVASLNGPAVTPETLFAAESMSQPATALAVLKLYEERKIELDRNVNDYLKRWKLPESKLSGPQMVTVRQLLTHTSGIGTHNGELYDVSKPLPTLLNDL